MRTPLFLRRCLVLLTLVAAATAGNIAAAEQEVHLYNWNDYFAEDTLPGFQ